MNSSHRRSGSRSAAALVLGLTLAGGLAACGDDSADNTASDPAASSSTPSPSETTPTETSPTETSPTETPSVPESGSGAQETIPATGSAGVTEASLISATEGGGSASTLAFALDSDLATADFAAQFDGSFADTVTMTADQVAQQAGDGSTVYGATAVIGCEAPRGVAIDAGEAGFEVIPKLPKSSVQCLAPVTYVVLFAVPDA